MTSTPEWARQKGLDPDNSNTNQDPDLKPGEVKFVTEEELQRFVQTVPTFEKQVGGTHYKQFKIQPAVYSEENGLSFLEGNVVKYVTRHQHKGGIADLEKAIHCLELLKEIHYNDDLKS